VLLDNKHCKMRDVLLSKGSLTSAIIHPRDVYLPVIRHSAAAVIFVHNHPSGDPTPSQEDIAITRRLREVGDLIGVRVLDHIVIGHGRYVSFVEQGYWAGAPCPAAPFAISESAVPSEPALPAQSRSQCGPNSVRPFP
jgi:DNA repair protein RadC